MLNAKIKKVRCALTAEAAEVSNMLCDSTLTEVVEMELYRVKDLIDQAQSILSNLED